MPVLYAVGVGVVRRWGVELAPKKRVLPPNGNPLYVARVNKAARFEVAPIKTGDKTVTARRVSQECVRLGVALINTAHEHAEVSRDAVAMATDRTELRGVAHEKRTLSRLRAVGFQQTQVNACGFRVGH